MSFILRQLLHRAHDGALGIAILALAACPAAAAVDAQREVWPILKERCVECHGPEKQKSSLRVDSRAALLKGGDEGPAVVAGDAAKSHLLALVTAADKEKRMPPKGEPLTTEQVQTLRRWIDQGAPWPEQEHAPRIKHWSFEPVARPPVPQIRNPQSVIRNPIDAFVAAKLGEHGLQPSPAADPRTFIRRATLDLTGLPATPDEVEAFVQACTQVGNAEPVLSDEAVRRLIDRLLASPRYGERWAQHWLDVIRYADTGGYEKNGIRPSAWPYRDYVIAALNADIAYPRFILEQLAGDTLGVDAATGFLVTPPFPSRIEVGQEAAAIAQARFNGLDEVVQNIGSSMLGMTVGCARCHDHKFDPVTARDYYRMAATFAGLQFVDRPWAHGAPAQAQAAEKQLDKIRRELAAYPAWRATEPISGADVFQPVRARYVRLSVGATVQKYAAAFDEIEIWTPAEKGQPPRNVGSARQGAVARSSGAEPLLGSKNEFLNDERGGVTSCWIAKSRDGVAKGFGKGEIWVEIELPETTVINRVAWRCDHDDQGSDLLPLRWRYVTDWTIEVAEQPGQWRTVVSDDRNDDLAKEDFARRKKLEDQYAKAAQEVWDWTHLFAGRFRSPPEVIHVLSRGDPLQPRAVTGPGGIAVLGSYELPPDAPETERRVALAKWLGDEKHPLTARVLVNRVWRHHFGTGIVETPGDFGTQGERPTHPELLDWLATEFMARGWRLKELHRLICTSATYRQSSRPVAAATTVDADTRWLWRFPARRLEAESIRDSVLFASGSLDLAMGGPGANIYQPRTARDMSEWKPLEKPGQESWRRTIYLLRMRGADDGVFKPFDVPDCGQVRAKRSESTTPLQALNLFNSGFILDQAGRLAARAQREAGVDPIRQIERIFALTLARPPSAKERADCQTTAKQHGLATVCRVIFNSNEFLFLE
jgi:mono/diheme cytochrome c family protein